MRVKEKPNLESEGYAPCFIYLIWVFGAIRNLAALGKIDTDGFAMPVGIEFWEEIDSHRITLMKPGTLGEVIGPIVDRLFFEAAGDSLPPKEVRFNLSQIVAKYFFPEHRREMEAHALGRQAGKDGGKGFG